MEDPLLVTFPDVLGLPRNGSGDFPAGYLLHLIYSSLCAQYQQQSFVQRDCVAKGVVSISRNMIFHVYGSDHHTSVPTGICLYDFLPLE